jgi:uncharacterized protein YecE (DUF72 family)
MMVRIGTAGWSIASRHAELFPREGSGLERYAARFSCVEINSSFYRSHRPETWSRWGTLVPPDFRFSVKVPRAITHHRKLVDCGDLIARLLDETSGLGEKLAVLLVQQPPKLDHHPGVAEDFFCALAAATPARIVCEPRHASWFDDAPDRMFARLGVARVAADPAGVPAAAMPGGWHGLSYWRLHGSPDIYRSPYGAERLNRYAALVAQTASADEPPWCIFDNTASSAATGDALALSARLHAATRDQLPEGSILSTAPSSPSIST